MYKKRKDCSKKNVACEAIVKGRFLTKRTLHSFWNSKNFVYVQYSVDCSSRRVVKWSGPRAAWIMEFLGTTLVRVGCGAGAGPAIHHAAGAQLG